MRHARWSSGRASSLALVALLVIAASVLIVSSAVAQPPPPFLGPQDLDGNGTLDGKDLHLFNLAYIAWRDTKTIINANADFNADGRIDYYDAMVFIDVWILVNK
jgi:hypothetical protein